MPTRATVAIHTLRSPHYGVRIAMLLGLALAVGPAPVLAETQVSGTPNALRIEAGDAPLEEILAALNRAFGVRYELSVNLDKRLSGTYEGPLPQVLTSILNGYSFIVYTDNGAIAVTVVGTARASGTSPGRPASSSAVRRPSPAAPPPQAPVFSSDVSEVAQKKPSSLLESIVEQSGAPASAPPPQPMPPTPAPQPVPSTAAPQPGPSMAALQPRPSTAAPQPGPSTAAPQPGPPPAAPLPGPSFVNPIGTGGRY